MSSGEIDIVGIGIVSPFGQGREPFWHGLMSGESRLADAQDPQDGPSGRQMRVARIAAFDPDTGEKHLSSALPRPTQMAVVAASEAWDDAGMSDSGVDRSRIGVYAASTYGLLDELADYERDLAKRLLKAAKPSVYQEMTLGALAGHVSIALDVYGPIVPLTQGWLGSLRVLELALGDLVDGTVDAALIVAVESLGEAMLASAREQGLTSGVGEAAVALIAARRDAAAWREVYARLGAPAFDGSDLETSDAKAFARAIAACTTAADPCDGFFGVGGAAARVDEIERAALATAFGNNGGVPAIVRTVPLLGSCGSSGPLLNVAAAALCCRRRELPRTRMPAAGETDRVDRPLRTAIAAAWAPDGLYAALALQAAS